MVRRNVTDPDSTPPPPRRPPPRTSRIVSRRAMAIELRRRHGCRVARETLDRFERKLLAAFEELSQNGGRGVERENRRRHGLLPRVRDLQPHHLEDEEA